MTSSDLADYFQKMFSLCLGAVGTWLALRSFYEKRHQETLQRFADGKQKEYAAQRDFEHLKRNQEQMQQSLRLLDEEIDGTKQDLKEIKGMLAIAFNRAGESISGIFGYREKEK